MSTNPYEPPTSDNRGAERVEPVRRPNRPLVRAMAIPIASVSMAFSVNSLLETAGVVGNLKHITAGVAGGLGAAVAYRLLNRR